MVFPTKLISLLPLSPLFLLIIIIGFFPSSIVGADNTDLVYKGCANQKFQDPSGIYSQNLKALLASLISQSSQKTFFTTTYGDGQYAIMGLYQCRGDLTTPECYNCVSKLPTMADKLCGKTIAARVQLSGCYLRYEIAGFKQVSDTELLYKVCGSRKVSGSGFEERREKGFEMVESGVKGGGNSGGLGLFYAGNYESVYVLGQCEGDLGIEDCGDCVKSAVETAKSECGNSFSAQVYLHKCYISYTYYPNGVPAQSSDDSSPGTGQKHTERTVAIVVGGVAAVGFALVCLLFARSLFKKRGGKHGGWN